MKKTFLRIFAIILIASLLVPTLAGCRGSQDSGFETPEFVFLPEIVNLPTELQYISNMVYSNDKIFFMGEVIVEDNMWESRIFSMNIDGTGLTHLSDFEPFKAPELDDENAMGGSYVQSIIADSDGNLWIFENWQAYIMLEQDPWYISLGQGFVLSKVDETGRKIESIDLSDIGGSGNDFFWIQSVNMDNSGNIYFVISGERGLTISVRGFDGSLKFELDNPGWGQLIRMTDGRVAFFGYIDSLQRNALQFIDPVARDFGETITLPQNVWDVYPGSGEFSVLYRSGNTIYGFISEDEESVKLLNWLDSNIIPDSINNLTILSDGRILCTNWSRNMITGEGNFELLILTRTPYSELPERKIISLASAQIDGSLLNQIVLFNRTNLEYRIHVIDYSEFNTEDDWGAGLKRLSTDIIAGNIPDILDVARLPLAQYVARGLLEDLYTFIDNDHELNRGDFVESVLRASEIDGGLYRIFPSFIVSTVIGHPAVLGPGEGWNMDEFRAVLNNNPQADLPMGNWLTKENFLYEAMTSSMDEYIDWAAGTVHFDTGSFAQLLEFANRFPAEIEWNDDMMWESSDQLIASGRQIMMRTHIGDFSSFRWQRDVFGGDVVFKGFPTEGGNGSSFLTYSGLAITTRSNNKDGAWSFIRENLTSSWQRSNANWIWGLPVNLEVFNEMAAESMIERDGWGSIVRPMPASTVIVNDADDNDDADDADDADDVESPDDGWWDDMYRDTPLTQEEVDQIIALINSTTNFTNTNEELMNIITEDASDFFNGLRSAQDTARIVQSRVSRLIAEQS